MRVLLLIAALLIAPAAPRPAGVSGAPPGRSIADAFVPSPAPVSLLPEPKEVRWGQRTFTIRQSTRVIVSDGAADEDLFAADELNEELRARFGLSLRVVREREVADPTGHILIGEPAGHDHLRQALGAARLSVSPTSPGPEGYVLRVTPRQVLVAGSDRRGTFYGVQTLRQLLRPAASEPSAPAPSAREVTIRDWPDHAVRAVHVLLDASSEEFHGALIDRILARYKFNTLIAEAEYVQWASGRPFWVPDQRGATKAQVQRLLEVARRHHVQVIPLVATLGHSEWVFAGLRDEALCQQLAYIPRRLREEGRTQVTCDRARGVFPAVYDPTRPVTIGGAATTLNDALILPVLHEAVDLFRPAYLHLGHDEVRGPGGLRYDMDLYLQDTITLARVLRGLSVRAMLWGDVLWERRQEAEAEPLFRDLPRDLTVVPWKYEDVQEYPEVGYFRQLGFPVLGATWMRLHNNYFFSRAARAAGAAGMIRTTWTGQFQNRAALARAYRQLYTYLTAAGYFWNTARPAPDRAPGEPVLAQTFADAWTMPSYRRQSIGGVLLDLAGAATQRHIDDDGKGWLGKGPDYDLRGVRPGRQRFGGVLFEVLDPAAHGGKSVVMLKGERDIASGMPDRVVVRWQGRAACLAVLHTALDRAASFGEVIGRYTVVLAGGRRIPIELAYGQNINSWLWDAERGISSIEQEVAWTGTTRAGNDVYLQMVRWKNPQPQTSIESIELASAGGRASPVVFAITALDRCP